MSSELKGRFATYHHENKATGETRTTRMSLNSIKENWGVDIAKMILEYKHLDIGSDTTFDLELLLGEKNATETANEKTKTKFCKALYLDLRESYPSFTYAWLLTEADRQIAGGKPSGGPSMFLHHYLIEAGLIKVKS